LNTIFFEYDKNGINNYEIFHQIKNENKIILVMPHIDKDLARKTSKILEERTKINATLFCIEDVNRIGYIAVANYVYNNTQSELFGYIAQDAFPGRNWLELAVNELKNNKPGLLAFNDGKWFGNLASFGIVHRDWADKNYNGNLFFNEYTQHYADVELSLIAMSEKCLYYNPNAVLQEIDYYKEKKRVNQVDKNLFNTRKKNKFNSKVNDFELINLFS